MTVQRGVMLKTKLPPKIKIPTVMILAMIILIMVFQTSVAAPNAPFGASTLGDFVWEDLNSNGVKDPGEPGINGVKVTIYEDGSNGNPLDGQIQPSEVFDTMVTGNDPNSPESTSNDGYYDFDVTAGPGVVYIVEIDDTNFDPGGPLEGHLYTGNNDTNVYNGDEPRVVPLPGLQVDYDEADFGYILAEKVNLGNLIWHDANNNGLVDPGEDGVDGIEVQLFRDGMDPAFDTPLAIQTTSGGGFYGFTDLLPGNYFIYLPNPPADFPMSSVPTDGNDNGEDNDDNGDQSNGFGTEARSPIVTINANEEPVDDGDGSDGDLTVDFGFFSPVRVGDLVWEDINNNGIVDPGEPGIEGVEISIFTLGQDPKVDTPVQTDITDADGLFSFEDLEPGEYFIYMATPPVGFPNSSDPTDISANNGEDNNDNGIQAAGSGTEVNSSVFELVSGREPTDDGDGPDGDLTIDFGFYADPIVNLGNLVWLDSNDNGVVDPGEDGIEGVEVKLFEAGDDPTTATPQATDVTDADGLYNFDELAPGDYFVVLSDPPSSAPTSSTPTDGADNGEDNDDNGDQPGGSGTLIQSPVVALGLGEEPDTPTDGDGTDGDLTVDFGLFTPLSVGNQVWDDVDNDGIQDPGEAGIEGVEVQLFPAGADPTNTTPLATDTTDPDGLYEFDDLPPGDYFLYIPTPPADQPNSSDVTDLNDNDEDNDDNGDQLGGSGAPVTSPVFNLTSGDEPTDDGDDENSNQTMDFGFYADPIVNLGNLVWLDKDDDGMVDSDESGIDGIVVELYEANQTPGTDTPIGSEVTSGGGFYNFLDLAPGDYVVHIPNPPADYPTSSTPTDGADNQEDNDDNGDQPAGPGTAVTSPVITLEPDSEPTGDGDTVNGNMADDDNGDLTVDFGFFAPMSLGDSVWHDVDNNGILDAGEPGIPGVVVELYEDGADPTTDAPIATETTDADGLYNFGDLNPGDYFLYLPDAPADFPASSDDTDPNDNGEDNDDNGSQGAPGAPVQSPVISLTSGEESTDDGPNDDNSPEEDSNGDQTVDFGFYAPTGVRLGNQVWFDENNDGFKDPEEHGVNGVVVELYEAGQTPGVDAPLATDTTDGDGFYGFNDLDPGLYVVYIPEPPADYPISSDNTDMADNQEDDDDNGDQPAGPGEPITSPEIMLERGAEPTDDGDDENGDQTVDFGLYAPPLSVGNQVWNDEDNDGLLDPEEEGIEGVVVELYEDGADPTTDDPVATVTTGPDGDYLFEDVDPGDYFLYIPESPADFPISSDNTDPDDNGEDNDDNGDQPLAPSPTNPQPPVTSPVFNLTPGTEPDEDGNPNSDETMDFGFYGVAEPVNLGNLVWLDKDNDGLVDPDESGIEGVVVELYEAGDDPTTDTPLATDTTDSDGLYSFDDLDEGTYFVYIPESPADAPASSTPTDMADNGEDNDDNGDQPLAPSPTSPQPPVRSPDITLGDGEEPDESTDGDDTDGDLTVDFGFYTPVDLGNQVWHDADNDGINDPEEGGIEGVLVALYEAGDDPLTATPVMTDTTDSGGIYLFEDLAPGDYVVYLPEPPAEHPNSSDNTDPADNGEDNDDNGIQDAPGAPIESPVITLVSGEEPTDDGDDENGDQTVDFGFYTPVDLGNLVWHDSDNDGIKDPEEDGIPGVVVELYEADDVPGTDDPIATDTTDLDGTYGFEDLSPGDYVVYIPEAPADFPNSSDNTDTADNGEDNDDNGDQPPASSPQPPVTSPIITLTSGDEPTDDGDDDDGDQTVDFGFYAPVSLGDAVWHDEDNDGIKDPAEDGISGVLVELFDADDDPAVDPPLTTDMTDGDGLYTFEDLSPGEYIVYIPFPPANFPASSDNTDPDDNGEDDDDNGSQSAPGAPVESPVITLTSGDEPTDDGDDENGDQTVDFGFYEPTGVRLGNQVWFDKDNDGQLDPGEKGVNDVVVELYEAGQTPGVDAPLDTDMTNGDGFYSFNDLDPGTYVVYLPEPPADYPTSSDNTDMADNGEDNDDNGDQPGGSGTPITSPEITLGLGEEPTDDGDDSDGDQTVDFGLYAPPLSVGNEVWHDADNDGIKDPEEAGIEGVVVELFEAGDDPLTDDPVDSVTTGPDGEYLFDELGPGDYFLYLPEAPEDFPNSSDVTDLADNGEDDDDNGDQPDGSGTPVTSPLFTLSPGDEPAGDGDPNSDETMDFGFYADLVVNIGDLVWFDSNNNGLVDGGEQPIAGVVVELYEAGQVLGVDLPLDSDITDAQGHYNFDELAPGDYVLYIPTPPIEAPMSSTTTDNADNGENNDDNGDQQPAPNNQSPMGEPVRSPVINLTPDEEPTGDGDVERGSLDDDNGDLTVDFGFFMPLSVGNQVWNDANNDGIAQADEEGIKGVVVELYPAGADPITDDPIESVTTDPDGTYLFDDVPPGDYFIYLPEPLEDYPNSSDDTDMADNGEDNDDNGDQPGGSGTPVTSPVFNLAAGEEPVDDGTDANDDATIDFGFYADPLVNLGNLVWLDSNDNGLVDAGEEGIEGVVVELHDAGADPATGTPVMTDTTDENGFYNFDDLTPGTYVVYIPEPPADYPVSSTPTDGADNGEDNDDNGAQSAIGDPITSPEITLGVDQEPDLGDDGDDRDGDLTVDFGLFAPLSVGNEVWHDDDNDGVRDPDEAGIAGVVVQLFEEGSDPTGTPVATTTTDEDGLYTFEELAPGDYFMVIPEPPADMPMSSDNTDTADNGEDDDDNGDQPAGAGTPVQSPVFNLTSGEEPTQEDGDPNSDETLDFGFYKPGVNLGDLVWHDENNDGVVGPTESGIPGVTVELFEAGDDPTTDDPIATDVTDGNGLYNFNGLEEGTYVVYVPEPPADFPASSDDTDMADNGEDNDDNGDQLGGKGTPVMSPEITLAVGDEPTDDGDGADGDLSVDFGFYMPVGVSLGDSVWHDEDNDGVKDPEEDGIEGVTVELYEAGADPASDDPIATDVTDENGLYNFDDLEEGTYVVYIPEPPADFPASSDDTDMADNGEDDDDNGDQPSGKGTPVTSPEITLTAGDEPTDDGDDANSDQTVDFGFHMPAGVNLGDLVWHDEDNDGVADPEEDGIEGVTVELYEAGSDPTSDDPIATDVTDASGLYNFDDLEEGTYVVYIPEPPADFPASSDDTDMEDNGEDDDDNGDQPDGKGTPVMSPEITLTVGDEPADDGDDTNGDQTVDFGFHMPAGVNLGDLVWHDENNDSIANPGEEGIEGVTVELYEAGSDPVADDPIATDVTDENGIYTFDDLPEGTYVVYIPEPPADFPVSSDNSDGEDNQEDDDDNGDQPDGSGTPVMSPEITLTAGDEPTDDGDGADGDKTVDFGFYAKTVSLGDEVWVDENNDGVRDAEEAPIEGVEVQLFMAGDDPTSATPVATDTTDADGLYHFPGLAEGTYVVYIPVPPADYPASSDDTDMADNGENDDDNGDQPGGVGTPVMSPEITLTAGDEPVDDGALDEESGDLDGDQTVDFGFWAPAPAIDVEKATNGQDADAGGGPAVVVGETVNWTYVVENIGNVALMGITLTDDREGVIECPNTELAIGESMTCEREGIVQEGAYENMATVEGLPPATSGLPPATDEDPSHYTGVPDSKVNLGNQVWHDENNDSILGEDEEGIDGVEVQLFNATDDPINDEPIATDTTSGGGFYAFNGLEPGEYVVYIPEPPIDFPASSSETDSDDNGQDGDDNGRQPSESGTPVISPVIGLGLGEETEDDGDGADGDLTVDFGFYKPNEATLNLGNLIWHDVNNNGVVDEGEEGIDDVRVQLFRAGDDPMTAAPVQSATTSDGGFYNFESLPEGDYFVYIPSAPAAYPGSSTVTDDGDNGEDNDDNGSQPAMGESVRSPVINLSFANEPAEDVDGDGSNGELTVDFGFWSPSAVGDRVWQDNNANGIQDPGEPNVPGVMVTLFQEDGTPMDMTATTDEQGEYLFTDLPPGSYYVIFDLNSLPEGFSPTLDNQGGDDGADSDAFGLDSSAPGQTDPTAPILSGEQDRTLDMGIYQPVRVGDKVWNDENRNGLQDDGEPGVAGVTVTLFNQDGTPVGDGGMTTTTNDQGDYLFEGLQPGSYYVIFDLTTLPEGFVVTTPNVGEDDENDSDANPSSGQTAPTPPLSSGEENMSLDMGVQQPLGVRLGDTVWDDSNANGIQDLGEPGVADVTVTLFNGDGTPTDRVTTTDANGTYLFEGLSPGSYYVVFDLNSLPEGYRPSDANVGDDDSLDSDADPSTGQTATTPPIPDGNEDLSLDMGLYRPATLGNFVWNDLNANGIQDPGEAGVPGVTVNLLDAGGSPVMKGDGTPMTVVTDPSGFYQFTDIIPGDYMVEFVAPDGMIFSPADQDSDDQTDSDADPDSGRTQVLTLTSGQNDPSWDAALYQTSAIGNFVWNDIDGNGLQNGEPGIPGVVVELYTEDGTLVATMTTDDSGGYIFDNLPPDNYYLQFTPPDGLTYTKFQVGDDAGMDSDVNPTLDRTPLYTLTPGEYNDGIDVGLTEPSSVGRFVWLDENQDGIKDDNEPGVAGIVVNLYNSETQELVDTTITDSNGFFVFEDLSPGSYALEFKRPNNYVFTEPGQGDGSQFNSDADPVSGITQPLVLLPGQSNDDSGAGLVLAEETIDKDGPNAIDLVSFTAEKETGKNTIRWVTGGEIATFGFHLYRSTNGVREDAVRITKQMVPARGAGGGEYVHEDDGILPGLPYVYWLVEVENGVEANEFGPVGAYSGGNFSDPNQPLDRNENIYVLYLPIIQR